MKRIAQMTLLLLSIAIASCNLRSTYPAPPSWIQGKWNSTFYTWTFTSDDAVETISGSTFVITDAENPTSNYYPFYKDISTDTTYLIEINDYYDPGINGEPLNYSFTKVNATTLTYEETQSWDGTVVEGPFTLTKQ